MGLTRKLRKVGHSLTIAVPAQLAAMLGLEAEDELEFDHIGNGVLRLRKPERFSYGPLPQREPYN